MPRQWLPVSATAMEPVEKHRAGQRGMRPPGLPRGTLGVGLRALWSLVHDMIATIWNQPDRLRLSAQLTAALAFD
jgi:hypothetical protein